MKMTKKSPWARILAVASAAVCAVTATAVGVNFPMAKADAADETYYAYLGLQDANYGINLYDESFGNSVALAGDGTYVVSATHTNTWCGAWTKFQIVLFSPQDVVEYSEENITIDSIKIGAAEYTGDDIVATFATGAYSQHSSGGYLWSTQVNFDYSNFATPATGDEISVTFTIGEGGDATGTTPAVTTVTETTPVTTATTAETEAPDETTTTAVVTTLAAEETEATTTTTTTAVTTTKATTTTAPNYDKEITAFTKKSEKGNDGNVYAYIEFEHQNAESITLVYKVLSNDTNTSGAIGTGGANWRQEDWTEIAVPSDKLVTIEYTVPSYATDTLKASVYWPGVANVQFVSVTLHYSSDPDVTTTTTTNELENDLTFETVTVGEDNKLPMLNKCYLRAVIKAPAGHTVSYGLYYQPEGEKLVEIEGQNIVVDETGLIVVEEEIRNCGDCNFKIHWSANGSTSESTALLSLETFYEGDASLNGKVNGSDVRAILNYLKSTAKTDLQDVVCDVNEDDSVGMADAVTLVKQLIGANAVAQAISE